MIYTAIDTFYLTPFQLENSPSRKDGVDNEVETTLRIYGAELIQEAGILLKLPQVVMATGQVLLHRFYCKQSFCRYDVKRVAASCVWLAAKLEEAPRRIRDILFVFHRINQRREGLPLEPLEQFCKTYDSLRTELIRMERHLLKEMGFICHVEHPHKFIPVYMDVLGVKDQAVVQEAWSLANDSLRTNLCVRFKSEVVACGVIYAATRRARIPLPEDPAWWLVFDATKPEIDEVCRALADLYRRPKTSYVEVAREHTSVLSSRAWEPPAHPKAKVATIPPTGGPGAAGVSEAQADGAEKEVLPLTEKDSNGHADEEKFSEELVLLKPAKRLNGILEEGVEEGLAKGRRRKRPEDGEGAAVELVSPGDDEVAAEEKDDSGGSSERRGRVRDGTAKTEVRRKRRKGEGSDDAHVDGDRGRSESSSGSEDGSPRKDSKTSVKRPSAEDTDSDADGAEANGVESMVNGGQGSLKSQGKRSEGQRCSPEGEVAGRPGKQVEAGYGLFDRVRKRSRDSAERSSERVPERKAPSTKDRDWAYARDKAYDRDYERGRNGIYASDRGGYPRGRDERPGRDYREDSFKRGYEKPRSGRMDGSRAGRGAREDRDHGAPRAPARDLAVRGK